MLLITMHEWFGPSTAALNDLTRKRIESETRLRGFVTALPLGQALLRIKEYEQAFRERYALHTALNFELLSVTGISDLTDDEIEASGAIHVEKLKTDPKVVF